jgi:branched-chain amino acid transport system substrate-binding protein
VYEEAGILMISSTASNPKLTDEGGPNIFRMVGRDDQIGRIAGNWLADRWGDAEIAILHDGQAYGKGLAEEVKKQLNERGMHEVMYEVIVPGQLEYVDVILKMKAAGVNVLFYGGYSTEAALLIRQAHDRGYDFQLVSGDSLYTEQFWLVAGPAGEGAMFPSAPDPREKPEAADLVRRFRAANYEPEGGTLYTYASIQVWAQAAEQAGTVKLAPVLKALRSHTFDTVIGRVGFDDNGDVTGTETYVWYIWKDGQYGPARLD